MSRESPRPFLKWAGGKGFLVNEILARLPAEIPFYIEPFVGGGAVFFALARAERIRRALLADSNPELINCYSMVRDHPEKVLSLAESWQRSEEFYLALRASPTDSTLGETEGNIYKATRTIWLNRNCFNGLYRLNSSGGFNAPYGHYKTPPRIDGENLLACSRALQGVKLFARDFRQILASAPPGATIYLDPPYVPVSDTANFVGYTAGGFTENDQRDLALHFAAFPYRKTFGLASNADTPWVRERYKTATIEAVQAPRRINRDATKRGLVGELLMSIGGID